MTLTEQFLLVADTYRGAVSLSRARVSTLVFNDGKALDRIARGGRMTTVNYETGLAWFAERWPAELSWPEGVARPVVPAPAVAGGEGEAGSVVAASVPTSAGGAP